MSALPKSTTYQSNCCNHLNC